MFMHELKAEYATKLFNDLGYKRFDEVLCVKFYKKNSDREITIFENLITVNSEDCDNIVLLSNEEVQAISQFQLAWKSERLRREEEKNVSHETIYREDKANV